MITSVVAVAGDVVAFLVCDSGEMIGAGGVGGCCFQSDAVTSLYLS